MPIPGDVAQEAVAQATVRRKIIAAVFGGGVVGLDVAEAAAYQGRGDSIGVNDATISEVASAAVSVPAAAARHAMTGMEAEAAVTAAVILPAAACPARTCA